MISVNVIFFLLSIITSIKVIYMASYDVIFKACVTYVVLKQLMSYLLY